MAGVRSVVAIILLTLAFLVPAHAQEPPCSFVQLVQTASGGTENNHVLRAVNNPGPPGYLCWITVTIAATSGYLMVFDAAAAPTGGGAATPATIRYCAPVVTNGTNGGLALSWPMGQAVPFQNGIVVGFSTTGCNTVTYSAASFYAGVQ